VREREHKSVCVCVREREKQKRVSERARVRVRKSHSNKEFRKNAKMLIIEYKKHCVGKKMHRFVSVRKVSFLFRNSQT
jgi:hypothetical protein